MLKPDGWDSAIAQNPTDNQSLPAGGYICRIIDAEVRTSKSGRQMLVLYFDIASGQFRNYFDDMHARRMQQDAGAKWPNAGTYYQLTEGDFVPRFKALIETFGKCNSPFYWNWDEKTLRGKQIGFIMREEEFRTKDGQIRTSIKPHAFTTTEAIETGKFKVPPKKKLASEPSPFGSEQSTEEDIPF